MKREGPECIDHAYMIGHGRDTRTRKSVVIVTCAFCSYQEVVGQSRKLVKVRRFLRAMFRVRE